MNRFAFFCALALSLGACQSPSGSATAPSPTPVSAAKGPQCGSQSALPAAAANGLVLLNLDAPAGHTVVFYRDSLLLQEWFHSNLAQWQAPADFAAACPVFFQPSRGIAHFACAGQTKEAWKLQGADGTICWVKKEIRHSFRTWENYFQQAFGVKRTPGAAQPLRTKPSETAESAALPEGREMFCATAVAGDWVQVTWNCHHGDPAYQGQNCHEITGDCAQSGWLRWRNGQELLVEVQFAL